MATRYWIGTQPDPDDRTQIEVSEEDDYRICQLDRGNGDFSIEVTDLLTGKTVQIHRGLLWLGMLLCSGVC